MERKCSVPKCTNKNWARGYCKGHYTRWRRGQELGEGPTKKHVKGICSVSGCSRVHDSNGLCSEHARRKRLGRDMAKPFAKRDGSSPGGEWREHAHGYIVRWIPHPTKPNQWITESQHRVVMEQHLGRKLVKGENVHHINGVRNDNRIENLELWVTKQPRGQRAKDLLEWAHYIIDLYEPDKDKLK